MNASKFEIAFYEAMSKWVSGGKAGPDPRGEWEYQQAATGLWFGVGKNPCMPAWDLPAYRWKPAKKRTVTIGGVELVAPETDAPALGSTYFTEITDGDVSTNFNWECDSMDVGALKNGKVFLSREDCQAMSDAQRKQRIGQQSKPLVTDEMVTRFLGWRLPKYFSPDCYISFDAQRIGRSWPIGTNLFNADQAREMLEIVIGGAS